MKVIVKRPCIDGMTRQQLRVGDIIEFTPERLACCPVGFVEVVQETKRKGRPKKTELKNE